MSAFAQLCFIAYLNDENRPEFIIDPFDVVRPGYNGGGEEHLARDVTHRVIHRERRRCWDVHVSRDPREPLLDGEAPDLEPLFLGEHAKHAFAARCTENEERQLLTNQLYALRVDPLDNLHCVSLKYETY